MHSSVLKMWFISSYSTDKLTVGAHFDISKKGGPLIKYILLGMLYDNKLDLKSLIKMLFSFKGILFFINRREEIFGLLLSRSFMADYQK